MSNAEDLNRLTACSLVLLGHIFYVLGNHRVRSTTMEHVLSCPEPRVWKAWGPGVPFQDVRPMNLRTKRQLPPAVFL